MVEIEDVDPTDLPANRAEVRRELQASDGVVCGECAETIWEPPSDRRMVRVADLEAAAAEHAKAHTRKQGGTS